MEIWKPIQGLEISNLGNVRLNGKPVRAYDVCGYKQLHIKGKHPYIHRLVASAFIPNPHKCSQVNHKDFNKHNNSVDNLEWSTPKQNSQHACNNGHSSWITRNRADFQGELNSQSKLTNEQVLQIRSLYSQGISSWKLGTTFGVSKTLILNIIHRKTWTHI